MMKIQSNDIKKGEMVNLRNGWMARIEDNKKGNTRLATVYGYCTEMGSIYAYDIMNRQNKDGSVDVVEHTPQQIKLYRAINGFFENSNQ